MGYRMIVVMVIRLIVGKTQEANRMKNVVCAGPHALEFQSCHLKDNSSLLHLDFIYVVLAIIWEDIPTTKSDVARNAQSDDRKGLV